MCFISRSIRADIGRSYKAIIRINAQSGKGGVAYILEQEFGYALPKLMHKEIGKLVNDVADARGTELQPEDIHRVFHDEYLGRTTPIALQQFKTTERDSDVKCEATLVNRRHHPSVGWQGQRPHRRLRARAERDQTRRSLRC
jgi:2-isopropylmalate synthase